MTVNHESTDSVERTSRLGGKNSKFNKMMIMRMMMIQYDDASGQLGSL